MNGSYRWLCDLMPGTSLSVDEIVERLTLRGAPVEDQVSLGAGLEDIVVARVESVVKHPDADRLSLCQVEAGEGVVQVVCGAPVIHEGGYYPFAGPGVTIPAGFTLERRKIRGEYSNGMLCSEKELDLGRDQSGIMQLEGELTPGQSLIEALDLDDHRLDIEVESNRGDLLSHMGIARELASEGIRGVELPAIPDGYGVQADLVTHPDRVEAGGVSIRIDDPDLCYRYLGAVIRGVSIGPSPDWLLRRLRAVGAQPINNVVDATNYVLLEMGQPLHAFDLNELRDSSVVVRRATTGERMTTLDDVDRVLDADMLMICDESRPIAIGGVMGGAMSEVSESTSNVLLECALFNPKSIRKTRRALGMSTDASYRFERGVDPEGMVPALMRAVEIILATAGGSLDGPVLDVCPRDWKRQTVPLRMSRVERVLGIPFEIDQVESLLDPLGLVTEKQESGDLVVTVPGFRSYDVTREIDLIEEIARTYGYDAFPEELGAARPSSVPDHPLFQLEDALRADLIARGLLEASNPAFALEGEGDVELVNPVSSEEAWLRWDLLPGLLRNVEYNFARGARSIRLFEMGTVFRAAGVGNPPDEESRLALVLTGLDRPPHWDGDDRPVDVWTLKEIVTAVLSRARAAGATMALLEGADRFVAEGTGFRLLSADGETIGRAGRVRDSLVDAPAWAGPVWCLEVTLPAEPESRAPVEYRPIHQHPGVERDLALLLPVSVTAASAMSTLRDAGGELLTNVRIFDLYRGEGIPDGARSVAYRLHLQAVDRTLTDEEADDVVGRVVQRLQKELGVEQRI
ncbi:MAG: phenylalanine--tRNA ligase subunit beta [Gemmatimonadota bacterium]|nr:MAG: phenylalanine--tRNA ligase subunit beta [Gemmatimonadota bacterium]